MSQVYQLQQFRDAARLAAAAGVRRETAVQFVRHEQATGRSGQNSVNLLERLAQRPAQQWWEALA